MRHLSCALITLLSLCRLAQTAPRAIETEVQHAPYVPHRRSASYSVVQVYGTTLPTSTVTTTTTLYKTLTEQTNTPTASHVQGTEVIVYTGVVTRSSTIETLTFTTTVALTGLQSGSSTSDGDSMSIGTSTATMSPSSILPSSVGSVSAKHPYTVIQITKTLVLTTVVSLPQESTTLTVTTTEAFTELTSVVLKSYTTLVTETYPAQTITAEALAVGTDGTLLFVPVTTVLAPSTLTVTTIMARSESASG